MGTALVTASGWDTRSEQRDGGESERAVIRSRAVRLLEYLEAVRGLREQPVRDVAEYQDRRWWAWELPAHPSCVLTATGDEPWLTVSKAQIPPAPPVPDDIAAYLRTGVTDPEVEPAFGSDFDDVFADDPEEAERLRDLLRGYVEGPWGAWVPQARTALRARKLYEELYDLRLRLQRESALIELVWGHGILSWTVDGTRIVHPMVTTQVQLSFDAETGAISVEPESLVPHLEIDLLQGLDVKGFDLLVDLRDRFRADPVARSTNGAAAVRAAAGPARAGRPGRRGAAARGADARAGDHGELGVARPPAQHHVPAVLRRPARRDGVGADSRWRRRWRRWWRTSRADWISTTARARTVPGGRRPSGC